MDSNLINSLLDGAIDLHVHVAPDIRKRKLDAIELIQNAARRGIRGVLLKSHLFSTTDIVYLLNRLYPETQSFGSITLNFTVGGINPQAVEAAIAMGARLVFMPTYASKYFMERSEGHNIMESYPSPSGTAGISLLRNGDPGLGLLPEVEEIIAIIARERRALATGHISPAEIKVLVERARQMGLDKIVINHPSQHITYLTPDEQKELAEQGAFIEHSYVGILTKYNPTTVAEIAQQIKHVGPQHCIISTDLGQPWNPEPSEGLEKYVQELLHCGLQPEEIKVMLKDNPLAVLGLDFGEAPEG